MQPATKLESTSEIQSWSTELYDTKARFVGDLASEVVDMLDIKNGERILDLGSGDGYLSEKLIARGARVVGVDYSLTLVERAKQRGIDARHGNGEELTFDSEFDGAFSNAAMHWMIRAQETANGVFKALKPGGRFVGEFAGARNARIIRREIHCALDRRGIDSRSVDPWFLPEQDEYRAILAKAGFDVKHVRLFDRPVVIDYPIADWIRTFGSPYLNALGDRDPNEFLNEITNGLTSELLGADGKWTVDYTRIRFHATRPRGGA